MCLIVLEGAMGVFGVSWGCYRGLRFLCVNLVEPLIGDEGEIEVI